MNFDDFFKLLLETYTNLSSNYKTTAQTETQQYDKLILAIKNNCVNDVSKILGELPQLINRLSADSSTLLHIAAIYGSDKVLPYLLNLGVIDVNQKNGNALTPLMLTITTPKRNIHCFSALLSQPDLILDLKNDKLNSAFDLTIMHDWKEATALIRLEMYKDLKSLYSNPALYFSIAPRDISDYVVTPYVLGCDIRIPTEEQRPTSAAASSP